jgi:hypothetical protein
MTCPNIWVEQISETYETLGKTTIFLAEIYIYIYIYMSSQE